MWEGTLQEKQQLFGRIMTLQKCEKMENQTNVLDTSCVSPALWVCRIILVGNASPQVPTNKTFL